jgi:hypothetical protein
LCGITETEFWNLTPAELDRRQWAYRKRQVQEGKDLIELAWWIEILHRQKTVPPLHVLQNPPRVLTGEEREEADADHADLVKEMGL